MEKKTIGQFIATLRKANGMTQRQLADKLNVSDKAVSRWERDESAPDLTLIPVIAEIFGVTSDEILRGERKNVEAEESPRAAEKTERQVAHMMNSVRNKLCIQGLISAGIAIIGLIVAMLCNFAFNRASLGFYLACAFYLVAAVCETVFAMHAFNSIDNSEYVNGQIGICRRRMLGNMEYVYSTIVMSFSFTIPLIIFGGNTYEGLMFDFWFAHSVFYGAIAIAICMAVIIFSNKHMASKLGLSEDDMAREIKLFKCRKKYFLVGLILSTVLICGKIFVQEVLEPSDFVRGKNFTKLPDYIEYMETPSDEYIEEENASLTDWLLGFWEDSYDYVMEADFESESHIIHTEDEYGREKEIGFVYASDGSVIVKYVLKNKSVVMEEYEWDGDTIKSITVYTRLDIKKGTVMQVLLNNAIMAVLIGEIVAVAIIYKKKKCKCVV